MQLVKILLIALWILVIALSSVVNRQTLLDRKSKVVSSSQTNRRRRADWGQAPRACIPSYQNL